VKALADRGTLPVQGQLERLRHVVGVHVVDRLETEVGQRHLLAGR